MDALSSSVPTLKAPILHARPREFYQFKTHHSLSHPHLSSATKPNSFSSKPSFSPYKTLVPPLPSPSQSQNQTQTFFPGSPVTTHRNPASGYAAALVDIAQRDNSLGELRKDVRRFSKLLHCDQFQAFLNDPSIGNKDKGQLVKEVAIRGNFKRHLVGLLKMLIDRNKQGMISEVLMEFQRIYDELSGTEVVFVSSAKKMEKHQLFGIANRVQQLTGAMEVKVRNLFGERLPSFAA
ncbi:putative ATP synthase delta chain [Tripterygium wilfordii]|uniref:Putative ATP synthase delta chain n=1 Tax=Tripterygium wilfordii TaxID=458696 RepID=A0A7J7CGV7_TRIWF|nr:ATP synthase delta chain, chloroplastic [Tripterygium wilfordii]KAF5733285.1 putative ATP synthase delta chain [Tripterygium wilfordii]